MGQVFSLKTKYFKNAGKSSGILSVRKNGNHVLVYVMLIMCQIIYFYRITPNSVFY